MANQQNESVGEAQAGAYASDLEFRLVEATKDLDRFRHILSTTTDMLAHIDCNFKYLAVNRAYYSAFGMKYDDIVGKTVAEVFGEAFFDEVIREP
ncbi:PAS domain S-box protein, partial [bacterium AH-315-F18]|nr:PAS domain S-box protein [bacterium AH-315-F18]